MKKPLAEFTCSRCTFGWKQSPGPTSCPACGSLYAKWVNYSEMEREKLKNTEKENETS
jgi:rubrerythrin